MCTLKTLRRQARQNYSLHSIVKLYVFYTVENQLIYYFKSQSGNQSSRNIIHQKFTDKQVGYFIEQNLYQPFKP